MSNNLHRGQAGSPNKPAANLDHWNKQTGKSQQSLRNGALVNKNINALLNSAVLKQEQRPSVGPNNKTVAINSSADKQRKMQMQNLLRDELRMGEYLPGFNSQLG